MSGTVRHGIVGCEGIGGTHAAAVERADGIDLVACSDIDAGIAEEFADEHDLDAWDTDVTELIAGADLDAVSVCTPSGTHSEIAIEAADAGAHVLCEKPLDVYLDDIDAMIAAAEDAGVTLAGVFQRRTHAEHRRAKRAIEEGELGRVVMGDTTVKWWRSQDYYDSGDWRGTREMDGGCLMNQGIHSIDLLQWLMGGVESVYAMTDTLTHDMEMEDNAAIAVRFEKGGYGAIEASTSIQGGESRVEINGTEGSYNSGTLALGDAEVEIRPDRDWGDGHARIVQDFADAIREGREPMIPGHEAREAVEVILAAYASADLGREVALDELPDVVEQAK